MVQQDAAEEWQVPEVHDHLVLVQEMLLAVVVAAGNLCREWVSEWKPNKDSEIQAFLPLAEGPGG